jgi:NADH dehydrogenase FAD-containing subunit
LGLFGRRASDRVLELLEDAGVELHLSRAVRSAADGALELEKGRPIEADRVVALPRLQVSNIPGLPQGKDGYIGTDRHMRVEGGDPRVRRQGRHLVPNQAGRHRGAAGVPIRRRV